MDLACPSMKRERIGFTFPMAMGWGWLGLGAAAALLVLVCCAALLCDRPTLFPCLVIVDIVKKRHADKFGGLNGEAARFVLKGRRVRSAASCITLQRSNSNLRGCNCYCDCVQGGRVRWWAARGVNEVVTDYIVNSG